MASTAALTVGLFILMTGKLLDISGLSEGWRYAFVSGTLFSGFLGILCWGIVDSQ